MDIVFRLGRASATDIHEGIPNPPTPTAVRTMLRNLESRGLLRHEKEGPRHIYRPAMERASAQRSAVAHLLRTFFGGSTKAAVAALLDASERPLDQEERGELLRMIRHARGKGA